MAPLGWAVILTSSLLRMAAYLPDSMCWIPPTRAMFPGGSCLTFRFSNVWTLLSLLDLESYPGCVQDQPAVPCRTL